MAMLPSTQGQLTEETNYLVGTFDDCQKTTTITLSTADKYLNKDISITANVQEGHLTVTEEAPTMKTMTLTMSNITMTPQKRVGALVTMPSVTCTVPGVMYQIDKAGWLDATSLTTAGATTQSTATITYGVTAVSLINGDTIQLKDSNGTWIWRADANGNTYIY